MVASEFLLDRSIAPTAFSSLLRYYLEHILGACFYASTVQRGENTQHREVKMTRSKNSHAHANGPTRRQLIIGITFAFGSLGFRPTKMFGQAADEISHSAESIHQEPVFKASRKRVYDALTETKQFDKIIELSGAMKSGMPPGA